MKKVSMVMLVLMMFVVFSSAVYAKGESGGVGNGVTNQNQVQTQNAGAESLLMINTAEKEGGEDSTISGGMRSEMAVEKMSEVAKKVDVLLMDKTLTGGVGQQVKTIAQEQKSSIEKVQNQIKTIDSRGAFLKAVIGPDYKTLKELESQINQNQLRIESLIELKNKLINVGDIALVQETITLLSEENNSIQEKINAENRVKSVLGWLVKALWFR